MNIKEAYKHLCILTEIDPMHHHLRQKVYRKEKYKLGKGVLYKGTWVSYREGDENYRSCD